MITLLDCKQDDGIQSATNCDPASQQFVNKVNSACRFLLRRGQWWGSVVPIQVAVSGLNIVWPQRVAAVLALDWHHRALYPQNRWFSYMPMEKSIWREWPSFCFNPDPSCGWGSWAGRMVLEQNNTTCVFNQITSSAQVQLTVDQVSDAGQTVTLFGLNASGEDVTTLRADGSVQSGEVVTLTTTTATSVNTFSRIDRILKAKTNGPVTATQLLSDGSTTSLGWYEPGDTSPEYLVTRIKGVCSSAIQTQNVMALCKLKAIPAVYDQDPIIPDNLEAIRFAVQSLRSGDAEWLSNRIEHEKAAIRELNLQLSDQFPDDSIPFRYEPFGGRRLSNHCF